MAFITITVVDDMPREKHRRAVRLGPRAVASTRPTDELMRAAGFVDVEVTDITAEFERTARGWQREYKEHEVELRRLLGDELDELSSNRRDLISGVEERLLQRQLVSGTAQK